MKTTVPHGLYIETTIETLIQTPIKYVQTVQTDALGGSSDTPKLAVCTVCTRFIGVCITVCILSLLSV
jgi:hypothetical protein